MRRTIAAGLILTAGMYIAALDSAAPYTIQHNPEKVGQLFMDENATFHYTMANREGTMTFNPTAKLDPSQVEYRK